MQLSCLHVSEEMCRLLISSADEECSIEYQFKTKQIQLLQKNALGLFLERNAAQLRKVLSNRKGKALKEGFNLNFVLRDLKDVQAFNNPENIIVWDNRGGSAIIYPVSEGDAECTRIYTDACYLPESGKAGIAFIIQLKKGVHHFAKPVAAHENCLSELLAAFHALETCDSEKIRIISDSVYVRKGLTEWIPNWELNNWLTANGKPAHNIAVWKAFQKTAGRRYIEFQWLKGHRGQAQNLLCDKMADEAARDGKIHGFKS